MSFTALLFTVIAHTHDLRHVAGDYSDFNNEEVQSIEVEATFYTARCEGCLGITKSGYDVRETIYHEGKRIISVDPDIIPLESIVEVQLENGDTFEAIAGDIGGDIKQHRIDVLVSTKEEAYQLGRQKAKIKILEEKSNGM